MGGCSIRRCPAHTRTPACREAYTQTHIPLEQESPILRTCSLSPLCRGRRPGLSSATKGEARAYPRPLCKPTPPTPTSRSRRPAWPVNRSDNCRRPTGPHQPTRQSPQSTETRLPHPPQLRPLSEETLETATNPATLSLECHFVG